MVIIVILDFESHVRNKTNLGLLLGLDSTFLDTAKNMGFRQMNLASNFDSSISMWP